MAETIHSPVEDYSGTVVGVTFTDGKGSTDNPSALAYFRRHGYTVGSASDVPPPRSASKADWVDYAVSEGTPRDEAEKMTRDDLAEAHG